MQEICRICIFIDGLDEIGGESDAAIEVVKSMLSADLKVCLSSRPDVAYTDAFDSRQSCQMLRLQDLTELDIKTYSRDRLQPHLQTYTQEDVPKLIDEIALRAHGVFLCVDLVVKAMIKGLKNHDSVEQLRTRVDSTPSDIEALYAQMLSSIELSYREEAAQLFQLALTRLSNSLLNVSFVLYNVFQRRSEMSIQEALDLCYRTQQRLPTVCAGLLEIDLEDRDSEKGGGEVSLHGSHITLPCRYAKSVESADISYQERYAHVVFIHRTAMDFLRQSKHGQLFLEKATAPGFSVRSNYVRGLLAKVNLLGFSEKPHDIRYTLGEPMFPDGYYWEDWIAHRVVFEIMENVSREEWRTAIGQRSLCDDIDRTLAAVYKKKSLSSPLSHWSARWGRPTVELDIFVQDLWSRRTSRSSSLDSFRSTRTEPTLFWDAPYDFLGFAASFGLYIHVLEVINLQEQPLDKNYASYLISCLIRAFKSGALVVHHQEGFSAILDLITELLGRGGNPNMYAGHLPTTIWGQFLLELPKSVLYAPTAFTRTMKAFLENGANIDIKTKVQVKVVTSQQSQEAPDSPPGPELYFCHEISALYLIRRCLRRTPEVKFAEEMLVAKGGKETHAFTRVANIYGGRRSCRLSQRWQNKLIAAVDEADSGYPIVRESDSSEFGYMICTGQLESICEEISENYLGSKSGVSSDEDDASDDEAEEDFFEPMDLSTFEGMQQ